MNYFRENTMVAIQRGATWLAHLTLLLVMAGCKTEPSQYTAGTAITVPASGCIAPKLVEPIEFDGYTVSEISSLKAVKFLMHQKLKSNEEYYGTDHDTNGNEITVRYDGLNFLANSNGVTIRTETVQQYMDADKTNYYAHSTLDMIAEDQMRLVQDKLEFMAKTKPSVHSYLIGRYLKNLPVTVLLSSLNASESDTAGKYEKILKADAGKGKTVRDYTKPWAPLHLTNMVWEGDTTLRFTDSTMEIDYFIKELARGDVDGDGCEDALILVGWHTQGSMGGSYTTTVTKTGPDQGVKWVGKGPGK